MKNKLTKRNINKDTNGLAPIIYLGLIGIIAIAGIGTYAYFSQPDITYNIAEGGLFNIAGVELSSLEIVAVAMGTLLVIAFLFKTRKKSD